MTTRLSTSARNAAANAVVDLIDAGGAAGSLVIRTGAQPATPQTAATGTVLATVAFARPAFGDAATGVASATDPAAVTGVAAGTAGWFRILDSAGNAILDGAVGQTGDTAELILSTTTISVGVTVDITGFTFTQPM